MKKNKIIAAAIVLILFVLVFFQCSSIGISGSTGKDAATGSAVDMSPMPANSEFMKDQ